MRFETAFKYLLLSAAAIGAASAESPARKRSLRSPAAAQAEADAPVAVAATAKAVEGDARAAIMTPQEEEDIRLLEIDDAEYWKKFLDGDEGSLDPNPPGGCTFDVSFVNRTLLDMYVLPIEII